MLPTIAVHDVCHLSPSARNRKSRRAGDVLSEQVSAVPLETILWHPGRATAAARSDRQLRHVPYAPESEELGSVGDMWAVDLDGMAVFLGQFHPSVSMHLDATGRRAGPDGGFAILRAMSPMYAEIIFRVHAEYDLAPGVYYTPAHFSGRLVVNRQEGTVEDFYLGIPTDTSLNVTLTYTLPTVCRPRSTPGWSRSVLL